MLYLLFCITSFDAGEAKELGFSDELQIGFARPLSENEFGADLLRLGFNAGATEPKDRTPGHRPQAAVGGAKCVTRMIDGKTCYEISIPIGWLSNLKPRSGGRLIIDLAFLVPESKLEGDGASEPAPNTFSYRVKYGNDSLVPVHFVELNLQGNH